MRARLRIARATLASLRALIGRFSHHIRPQRWLLVSATVALLLESAMRLLEPWPLKFVLDRVIVDTPAGGSSGIAWLDALGPTSLLVVCAITVAVIAGARAGAMYLATVCLAIAGNRVLTNVRSDLYRHVQRLSLAYHSRTKSGDLLTRLTGDVGRLQEVSVTAALPLFANTLTLAGMVVVMLVLNWQLALVALALFPLFALMLSRRGGEIRGVSRKQRAREGELASSAAETIGAIRVVQALSLEKRLEQIFASRNEASLKEGVQAKRMAAGLERKVDLLVGVGTALVLFVGARQVQSGALTPGDLVVFLLYLKTAFKPMRDLAKYTGRIARAAASGERIVEVLDTEPDIRERPGAVAAPPLAGRVRFRDVGLSYADDGRPALEGIEFTVEPGDRVALVGPSGAGKSTLTTLLPRLYDPSEGSVEIDGRDVRDYTLESLRGQIAVVLQESVLFGITVRENIAFGAPDANDDEIQRAAILANAHGFIEQMPNGYDTVLGERGATLSGGQRQRIAIARAAVRDASVMVLDEPMTGLDRDNEREVGEALDRLTERRTTFLVAHDLRTAEDAHLILYLDQGRIVERGTHAELIAAGGRYATTHALQSAAREVGQEVPPAPPSITAGGSNGAGAEAASPGGRAPQPAVAGFQRNGAATVVPKRSGRRRGPVARARRLLGSADDRGQG